MKHLFEMIRKAFSDLLDRMTAWATTTDRQNCAVSDLADVTSKRYARNILLLAENLEPFGYDPILLVEVAYLKICCGYSPEYVMDDMQNTLCACERSKRP
jgi:hypothetical protein